jgi:hypothetical protein
MQEVIVAIIVAYAAFVVVRRYAPKSAKLRMRGLMVRSAGKLGWGGMAQRLADEVQDTSCSDGCNTCGGCGSATPTSEKQFTITPEALKRTILR